LSAFDVAAAEHTQRRHVADADEFCCRFERNLAALRPLAVAEDGDVVVIAEAAHALLRPGIAVPGLDASAIEQARDLPIRHQPRQLTHECDRVVGDAWIVPAGRIQALFDLQLGMVAALPVQDRMDDCAVPAHDDLRECRAKDTLARCGGCSGMQPGALQISTERHQLLALGLTERRRTARNQGGDLSFKLCDSLQCLVPAALQLAGDQPVCRVDGVVLSARVRGFVARLLQRQLQLALGRGRRARLRLDRFECCFDAERLQDGRTSLLIAASMLKPLIEMQRAAPWFVRAP